MNVVLGERYKNITKETRGDSESANTALRRCPSTSDLQNRVLDGKRPITCRPADLLSPEIDKLTGESGRTRQEETLRGPGSR